MKMSRYSHHSRHTSKMNNVSDDEEEIGIPKLSNFGSALLSSSDTNFTKFQYYNNVNNNNNDNNNNNTMQDNINNITKLSNIRQHLTSELELQTTDLSTSSSIFANTANQTSIRPNSMTTMHSNHNHLNTANNNNSGSNNNTNIINNGILKERELELQKLKQSMREDLFTNNTLERRNKRRFSRNNSFTSGNILSKVNTVSTMINSQAMTSTIKSKDESINSTKYLDRKSWKFLNSNRMNKLGPAKRASTLISNETNELSVGESLAKETSPVTNVSTLMVDSNINDNNNGNDANSSYKSIDYSSIIFGDLNPFQYVKKFNIPTSELPQISKIYFERQKEENRLNAMRKRSNTLKTSIHEKYTNTEPFEYDKNKMIKKREALSSLNINKREFEIKRMKSDPQQINKMSINDENKSLVDSKNNHNNIIHNIKNSDNINNNENYDINNNNNKNNNNNNIQIDKENKPVKPIKRVAIKEPTNYKSQNNNSHGNTNSRSSNSNPVITVNDTEYEKIELLGRGGSSKVYKVKGPSNKIYALKRVAFDEFDETSIESFKGEISLLEKLRNQDRVVQLFDYEMNSGLLYLIMECGDYDLSLILNQKLKKSLDIEFIRYYAREMIKCVQVVHDNGIVHSDLKPANFVFVKGMLKIIDFGIANAVPDHTVNIYRETQIGTPNYMAPEALVAMNYTNDNDGRTGNRWKVGKPSDIWSIGCIIYQMVYGKPPYGNFQGQNRLLAIMNPEVKISFPEKTSKNDIVPRTIISLMKDCLHRDPNKRLTITQMLQSNFFNPIMISESFIRNLIKNAVEFGCEQREVSGERINDLANDVINRLSEFRL